MGLHNTAHYLKSKGRGRDTELVHMSKREIKGLQDLAKAAGGSLTVNPDTGLVEAGFLEDALPVVAAAAATYFTAGAAAPYMTAALGSSMAGGIAAGALAGAGISGLTAAITGKDVGNAALMGGIGGGISGGLGAYGDANFLADATQKAAVESGTQVATQTAATGVDAAGNAITMANPTGSGFISGETGLPIDNFLYPNATQAGTNVAQMAPGAARNAALDQLAQNTGTLAEGSKQLAGQPTYYSQLKPDQYIQKAGILGLPAAGLLMDQPQQQLGPEEEESTLNRLSPNFQAYVPPQPNPYYRAQYPTYAAEGGIMSSYQSGGPVERMSQMNTALNPQGGMYPQGMIDKTQYALPTQRPTSMEVLDAGAQRTFNTGGITQKAYLPKGDAGRFVDSDPNTRNLSAMDAAQQRLKKLGARSGIKMAEMPKTGIKSLGGDFSDMAARGGVAHLGDYSDGGRLLKGPGDGVSDNIPATIGGKQPARLADGEFVVPARIVSELGNGSTEAGAKRLYAMMDRVQKARKKTIGKGKIAKDSKSSKYLPA
jgi:uncharacterized protein YdbL (DUF1318 family)